MVFTIGDYFMEILFYSEKKIHYIIKLIEKNMKENSNEPFFQKHYDDFEYIKCALYDISIENSYLHGVDFYSITHEYNMVANYSMEVNIFSVTYEQGLYKIAHLVKFICDRLKTDIVVLSDTAKVVYKYNFQTNTVDYIDKKFWKHQSYHYLYPKWL
jgi:hypothetical protein